jgi:hypothetical protein
LHIAHETEMSGESAAVEAAVLIAQWKAQRLAVGDWRHRAEHDEAARRTRKRKGEVEAGGDAEGRAGEEFGGFGQLGFGLFCLVQDNQTVEFAMMGGVFEHVLERAGQAAEDDVAAK